MHHEYFPHCLFGGVCRGDGLCGRAGASRAAPRRRRARRWRFARRGGLARRRKPRRGDSNVERQRVAGRRGLAWRWISRRERCRTTRRRPVALVSGVSIRRAGLSRRRFGLSRWDHRPRRRHSWRRSPLRRAAVHHRRQVCVLPSVLHVPPPAESGLWAVGGVSGVVSLLLRLSVWLRVSVPRGSVRVWLRSADLRLSTQPLSAGEPIVGLPVVSVSAAVSRVLRA